MLIEATHTHTHTQTGNGPQRWSGRVRVYVAMTTRAPSLRADLVQQKRLSSWEPAIYLEGWFRRRQEVVPGQEAPPTPARRRHEGPSADSRCAGSGCRPAAIVMATGAPDRPPGGGSARSSLCSRVGGYCGAVSVTMATAALPPDLQAGAAPAVVKAGSQQSCGTCTCVRACCGELIAAGG